MKFNKHFLLMWLLLTATAVIAQEKFRKFKPSTGSTITKDVRLVIDPQGHSAMIRDVLFTPDGKTVISVSDDKTIRLWNASNGTLRKTIRGEIGDGHMGKLNAAALSPDGNLLAVGGYLPDDEIRIIHLASGKQIARLVGHGNVITDLDFSADGMLLASASGDKTVKIWRIPPLNQNGAFSANNLPTVAATLTGHTQPVYGVAFSKSGRQVVSASFDATLRLQYLNMDGTPQGEPKVMQEHQGPVYTVAFSPDGRFIASGGLDGNIYLWDSDGNFYNIIEKLGDEIYTLSFSYELNKLVAMTASGTVYEIPYGLTLGRFTKHNNTVRASAFAPIRTKEGSEVIATAGGINNDIYLWDAENGQVLQHMTGKGGAVFTLAFSEDGHSLAFSHDAEANLNVTPFEKVFDLDEMRLSLEPVEPSKFRSPRINYGGRQLTRRGDYVLDIGNGKKIENESSNGRTIRAYTFTDDGRIVVGSAGALRIYDAEGVLLGEFDGHSGEVWAVAVSADGKLLASAGTDQTIMVWNIDTGERLASLYITLSNDWIAWTPQGFYDASAGGEQYIGWHINRGVDQTAEYFPVKAFRKKFFIPELVKSTIATGSFNPALIAYNQVAVETVDPEVRVKNILPPKVEWLKPMNYITEVGAASVKVEAKVTSDKPITEVKLLVDGRPVPLSRGYKVVNTDSPTQKWVAFDVPLSNRETTVQVFAAHAEASGVSDERVIRYKPAITASTNTVEEAEELNFDVYDYIIKPNLYLLSIGISDFQNSDWNLNYADDDARAVVAAYKARYKRLYSKVISQELIDKEANRSNILQAFKWLEQNVTHRDVVVIFVASHGFNQNREFYILPHDGDPKQLANTTVSWSDFAKTLGNLPSKVLLYLDACHSGQLGTNVANNTEAVRTIASEQNGVVIMAASTGDESSLEHPDWGHGAFTYALLEGIEKGYADLKPDKVIYLRELDFYVADKVHELTNGRQNPTTQKPSTISNLPIASLD